MYEVEKDGGCGTRRLPIKLQRTFKERSGSDQYQNQSLSTPLVDRYEIRNMKFTEPKVKLSRQLGLPLTPRALKDMERRPYPPGEHGPRRQRGSKMTDYKRHLLEKQRVRAQYNLRERQMRNYIKTAGKKQGNPEDNLVQLLESRLDAVVYRSGMARTIYAARQYISHRHILVNGKWVNMPGHQLRIGDVVAVKPESRDLPCFVSAREEMVASPPPYLERNTEAMSAKVLYRPKRQEVPVSGEMILVFEHYSK